MNDPERKQLQRALAGDTSALRALIAELTPIVRTRVVRVLGRRMRAAHRHFASEVADLTQETFMFLFADNAKALRAWDSERGLSFTCFVGLIAQRRVAEIVRSRRWREHSTELTLDDSQLRSLQSDDSDTSEKLGRQETMQRVLRQLERTLSLRALDMFERLYVQEQSVEEICAETGASPENVYQWRSRLTKAARQALQALEPNEPTTGPQVLAAQGGAGGRVR
jgi:RNA polymerase sigma factor (sigma-70 family)